MKLVVKSGILSMNKIEKKTDSLWIKSISATASILSALLMHVCVSHYLLSDLRRTTKFDLFG